MTSAPISVYSAILATFLCGLVIFAERGLPFFLFDRRPIPAPLMQVERYIPSAAMAILLMYCLKDVSFAKPAGFVPELGALLVTVFLHIIKRNALISIFCGTALYMILLKFLR